MRIFCDTEFAENGNTIDLISIGLVAEDGRELYLQSCEFDEDGCNSWVKANVLPQLKLCPCCGYKYDHEGHGKCRHKDCPWRTREQIRQEIIAFIGDDKPELWGYYSAYDHVALCQLFGAMINLPDGWPMYTRDIKQWCDVLGDPRLPEQNKNEHHALSDARHNRVMWEFLRDYEWRLPTMDGVK